MAPFRGFVTREPGQGGIQNASEAESGNRKKIERGTFMPLTAEGAEVFLATVPLRKIRAAELLEKHILGMFLLNYAPGPCMRERDLEIYCPSQCLLDAIDDIENFYKDLTALSYARNMVEQILIHCISEERDIFEEKCDQCYPSSESRDLNQWPLRMFQDMELGLVMRWREESLILNGVADFTLAVGGLDGPSSHPVVVEVTDREEQFDETYPPGNLLGSMAIVRLDRKLKGYPPITVHGILTDGNQFAFSRLESDRTISRTVYCWDGAPVERASILTSIRDIIRDVVNGTISNDAQ